MIVLAQYLQHQGEQFLVVLNHQDLARILADEDALVDWCQLRLVIGSRLGIQLRFLACLSDGFLVYSIWFVRVVYFVWCIRTFSDRQGDGEGSTFAFLTFTLDIAMMQFHQVVGQRQSDAGSRHVLLAVVAIEESGVEMLHLLLRHTDAIIGNRDDRLILAETERYINLASHLIIFNGVGEQIVDNLIHLVCIKPCRSFCLWLLQ